MVNALYDECGQHGGNVALFEWFVSLICDNIMHGKNAQRKQPFA